MSALLGEIVEKDGRICLQAARNVWYPLDGNSGIAEDFRENYNMPIKHDIGRRLYRAAGGHIVMENREQADARKAGEKP